MLCGFSPLVIESLPSCPDRVKCSRCQLAVELDTSLKYVRIVCLPKSLQGEYDTNWMKLAEMRKYIMDLYNQKLGHTPAPSISSLAKPKSDLIQPRAAKRNPSSKSKRITSIDSPANAGPLQSIEPEVSPLLTLIPEKKMAPNPAPQTILPPEPGPIPVSFSVQVLPVVEASAASDNFIKEDKPFPHLPEVVDLPSLSQPASPYSTIHETVHPMQVDVDTTFFPQDNLPQDWLENARPMPDNYVQWVCPFLKIEDDPTLCFAYASPFNACFKVKPPQLVALQHQEEICLSGRSTFCPILTLEFDGRFPPELKGKRQTASNLRVLIFRFVLVFAILLVLAGGAYTLYTTGMTNSILAPWPTPDLQGQSWVAPTRTPSFVIATALPTKSASLMPVSVTSTLSPVFLLTATP